MSAKEKDILKINDCSNEKGESVESYIENRRAQKNEKKKIGKNLTNIDT